MHNLNKYRIPNDISIIYKLQETSLWMNISIIKQTLFVVLLSRIDEKHHFTAICPGCNHRGAPGKHGSELHTWVSTYPHNLSHLCMTVQRICTCHTQTLYVILNHFHLGISWPPSYSLTGASTMIFRLLLMVLVLPHRIPGINAPFSPMSLLYSSSHSFLPFWELTRTSKLFS